MSAQSSVSTRPALLGDAETLDRIIASTEDPGVDPRPVPGTNVSYLRYLIERGRVVVADADGQAVGFGASVRTGRSTHLADLFVLPDRQGLGIGGQLLREVLRDDRPLTTFASSDPRAMPLYLRAGMRAYWPNLYLAGDPARLPAPSPDLRVVPADLATVARLDAGWTGADRSPDIAYWDSLRDVRPFVVERVADGTPIGTGFGRRRLTGHGRWLARAAVAPEVDGPPVLLAALVHGLAGVAIAGACVPGASPLAGQLLAAGFRVADHDTFLASDPTVVDPLREIVDTGVL